MFKYQVVDTYAGERPEYEEEKKNNPNWDTILQAETAEELLVKIADWLNDENYPTSQWSRIVFETQTGGMKVLHV